MTDKSRETIHTYVDNRHSGGTIVEEARRRCCHCQNWVILSPTRQRPRNWCRTCDDYHCDTATCFICTPFEQQWDRLYSMVQKGKLFVPG